jgi:hypothetical protein
MAGGAFWAANQAPPAQTNHETRQSTFIDSPFDHRILKIG